MHLAEQINNRTDQFTKNAMLKKKLKFGIFFLTRMCTASKQSSPFCTKH